MPQGSQITIFASRNTRKGHQQVGEWILETASSLGIHGATVVECSEGVDSHGRTHAAHFLELTDEPVAVIVVALDGQIDSLLAELARGDLRLFYTRIQLEFGYLGEEQKEKA
jgi:PII-like signaling protein